MLPETDGESWEDDKQITLQGELGDVADWRSVMKLLVNTRLASLVVAIALVGSFSWVSAQQRGGNSSVAIDSDDIGGIVTSAKGPEAGVWVVAETTDLPTRFIRIVVT